MSELTRAEKASLVVGASFWSTVAVEHASIRSVILSDGPHGLRAVQPDAPQLGNASTPAATCFPPAAGIASSWNPQLVERVGVALGDESRAAGVGVLLGPGVNIKRSPLCGRNFEYFSEDPLLSGELGAAWVRGVQSRGVGASLKHFAANNEETNRMTVSAEVDERTLREIYLPAFERIVTREQPWTVMCSYNKLNGIYTAEHHWLLTDVLRGEWGFEGLVVSDWGAVEYRVPSLLAGLDVEMPGPQADSQSSILAALDSGQLPESTLDESVARIGALAARVTPGRGAPFDVDDHHALARAAAIESMVLLRNENAILPLAAGERVAVMGEFARTPRFQGAGSSQVNPTRVDSALDAIRALTPVDFAPGFGLAPGGQAVAADAAALLAEAVDLARTAATVLLFVGLPAGDESEGYDRTHLDLPDDQVELIARLAAVNPRTIVVLTNGAVVNLEPWHDSVPAILESWLLGQGGGSAVADVLFGVVAPSGRLAESIPYRLQDTPSFLNFPGENDVVRYGEGIFVGYRYYETIELPVRYPFGHGLTYTNFEYSGLALSRDGRTASVTVTNVGQRAGQEVVQLYVGAPAGPVAVPRRELRAFDKIALEPSESRTVEFTLDTRAYSYWDTATSAWVVAGGHYRVEVGRSSSDILLSETVTLKAPKPRPLSLDSRVSEFLTHPVTGPIFERAAKGQGEPEPGATSELDMVSSMPMRRLMRYPGVGAAFSRLGLLVAIANNPVVRGVAGLFRRSR
jgi:beta-glucosidase